MSTYPYTRPVTPDTLNREVEFDSPFIVNGDGTITTGLSDVYSPEVYHVEWTGQDPMPLIDVQRGKDVEIMGTGWKPWSTGYSGQDRYRGAVMHASEYLGGGMARNLLNEPGTYVVCAVEVLPEWVPASRTIVAQWLAGYPFAPEEARETEHGLEYYDEEPEPAGWIVLKLDTDQG